MLRGARRQIRDAEYPDKRPLDQECRERSIDYKLDCPEGVANVKFRAVTLHLRNPEEYPSYSDLLRKVSSRLGSFTTRAVSPEPSDTLDLDLKAVYSGEGLKGFDRAWDLLKSGYYTSVSLGTDPYGTHLSYAASFIRRVSRDLGPEYGTMLALTSEEPPEGPYFPASKSSSFGLSASLLYPSDLYGALYEAEEPDKNIRHVLSLIFFEASERFEEAVEKEVPVLGIDHSLSPWMEESVAKAVSLMTRAPFLSPGTATSLLELNRAIGEASEGLKSLGFNEVMLPMAEDDLLKEMALEGSLTARDLVSLTPYCITGLDMVVLPESTSDRELAALIGDVLSSSYVKGKILGIRIILADGEPGEEVELGRFGRVPVMRVS